MKRKVSAYSTREILADFAAEDEMHDEEEQKFWKELERIFEPLFIEKRFDVQVVDKGTQFTSLSRKDKIKAIELLLTKKREDIENSGNEKLKRIINSSTAEMICDTMAHMLTSPKKLRKSIELFHSTDPN